MYTRIDRVNNPFPPFVPNTELFEGVEPWTCIAPENTMLHIIRRVCLPANVILYTAEEVRDLLNGPLYPESRNTVYHDRVIKVCPESDLLPPAYQISRIEFLQAVREKAVFTVFIRFLKRLIIDPSTRYVIVAVPEMPDAQHQLGTNTISTNIRSFITVVKDQTA